MQEDSDYSLFRHRRQQNQAENLPQTEANIHLHHPLPLKPKLSTTLEDKEFITIEATVSRQQSPNSRKQCRICLQNESEGRLIRPCVCQGSIGYTHENCIIEWIKHRALKGSKVPIQCELCHTPLKYKVSRRRDLDCNEFKTNFDKDRCNFIVFFLLEAGLFAVFLALVVLLGLSNSGSTLGDKIRDLIVRNQNVRIVFICAVFITILVIMFLAIMFMLENAVKTSFVVTQVLNWKEKKKHKIFPKQSNAVGNAMDGY